MAKKKVNHVTGEEILDPYKPDPRKRRGERTRESILAESPPGAQIKGSPNRAPFTGRTAPMLGRTQSAIDREAGPAPQMRLVPSEIRRRNVEAQQANMPIMDSQRMQDSEREARFQQESMGMGQPEMDMPPAPQPEMNMPPAPPTNEFGQRVRGVLPGESAPEDPEQVMEKYGRGSHEHVRALQDQMRTQQVARSRTEDMYDPRLAHLPTASEYQMDLTRRTHGEGAIDKRAGQLQGEVPFRSQEEAVRLAGREALDQKRQDRGMLPFEDRDAQRADLRMKQKEMFEQRRDDRDARRQEKKDLRQLEIDARRAGMSIPEYQRYQKETGAIGQEERIAELQAQTNQAAIEAGERTAETTAGAQVRSQEIQSGAAEAMNKLDSKTKVDVENIRASVSQDQIEQSKREMLGKEWFQSAQLQMMEAKNFNEAQAAFMQIAQQENLGRKDLFAFAESLVSSGVAVDATTASSMAALAAVTIDRAMGETSEQPSMTPRSADIPAPPPVDEAAAPPAAPPPAAPPAARPRQADRQETRRPEPAPEPASDISGDAISDWLEPTRNIPNTIFGMGGVSRAEAPVLKAQFSKMDKTASDILSLSEKDPEQASLAAQQILQAMTSADDDWTTEATSGVFSGVEGDLRGAKKSFEEVLIAYATGNFGVSDADWKQSLQILGLNRTPSRRDN